MRAEVVLAIAMGLLVPVSPSASAGSELAPGRSFTFEAKGCPEIQVVVPITMQKAEKAVPAPFVPSTEPLGFPTVGITVAMCEEISVDGGTPHAGILSDVGIAIKAPDKSAGSHIYQVFQPTNHPGLAQATKQLGMRGGFVEGMTAATTATGGDAEIPWDESPYSVTVRNPNVGSISLGSSTNTWWHEGRRGTIRIQYSFEDAAISPPMVGVVEAAPGSPLAELMGAETGIGIVSSVLTIGRYTGTAELVDLP